MVLLHHGNSGSPQNGSSSSAPPSTSSTGSGGGTGSTLPPALLTTAINQPLTGPPPPGYKNLTKAATGKESAGFTINYPSDWTVTQKGAYQTWLYAPQSGVNMLVDLTPHTYPNDMVAEAQYIETQSIPHFPGYQRKDLKALTIRGTPGSFWKFTWLRMEHFCGAELIRSSRRSRADQRWIRPRGSFPYCAGSRIPISGRLP